MSRLLKIIWRCGGKAVVLLLLTCVAVACFAWWFESSADDELRLLAVNDTSLGFGDTESLAVFRSAEQLRGGAAS